MVSEAFSLIIAASGAAHVCYRKLRSSDQKGGASSRHDLPSGASSTMVDHAHFQSLCFVISKLQLPLLLAALRHSATRRTRAWLPCGLFSCFFPRQEGAQCVCPTSRRPSSEKVQQEMKRRQPIKARSSMTLKLNNGFLAFILSDVRSHWQFCTQK